MEPQEIVRLYERQRDGGPIQDLHEWQLLLPRMYNALVDRAWKTPWDILPITYKDLGAKIGLPYIPDYMWWPLKMGALLGACADYEHKQGRPMITSIVVNGDTGMPGEGFWTLEGIPPNLRVTGGVLPENYLRGMGRDVARDEFVFKEMRRVNDFWKSPERATNAHKANQ